MTHTYHTGPPCPRCGRCLTDHAQRWSLDDYVAGLVGRGPRIYATQIGRTKCVLSDVPTLSEDAQSESR